MHMSPRLFIVMRQSTKVMSPTLYIALCLSIKACLQHRALLCTKLNPLQARPALPAYCSPTALRCCDSWHLAPEPQYTPSGALSVDTRGSDPW